MSYKFLKNLRMSEKLNLCLTNSQKCWEWANLGSEDINFYHLLNIKFLVDIIWSNVHPKKNISNDIIV